jgi:hypothetical protein
VIDPRKIDLPDFLVTWYGAPSRSTIPLPDSCDWLPRPLKEWHALTSRWEKRLTFTTTMIPPEKIRIAEDRKAIFMVDDTGDWRWCIDPGDPDGVFDAERYGPWERNPEQLPDFLVHNTVREVVYGAAARIRASAVPEEILTEILAPMEEVAFGAWKWPTPSYRIFLGGAVLAETVEADPGPGWDVEVVASEFGRLAHLEGITGVHWRRQAR